MEGNSETIRTSNYDIGVFRRGWVWRIGTSRREIGGTRRPTTHSRAPTHPGRARYVHSRIGVVLLWRRQSWHTVAAPRQRPRGSIDGQSSSRVKSSTCSEGRGHPSLPTHPVKSGCADQFPKLSTGRRTPEPGADAAPPKESPSAPSAAAHVRTARCRSHDRPAPSRMELREASGTCGNRMQCGIPDPPRIEGVRTLEQGLRVGGCSPRQRVG